MPRSVTGLKVQALRMEERGCWIEAYWNKKGNEKEIWAPGIRYFRECRETVRLFVCGKSPWAFLKEILAYVVCLGHM